MINKYFQWLGIYDTGSREIYYDGNYISQIYGILNLEMVSPSNIFMDNKIKTKSKPPVSDQVINDSYESDSESKICKKQKLE